MILIKFCNENSHKSREQFFFRNKRENNISPKKAELILIVSTTMRKILFLSMLMCSADGAEMCVLLCFFIATRENISREIWRERDDVCFVLACITVQVDIKSLEILRAKYGTAEMYQKMKMYFQ